MLARKPFVTALMYVPTNMVDVQLVMNQLRVRYENIEDKDTYEDDYVAETKVDADNGEIICYDLSKPGYIGVPRSFGMSKLGITEFINLTTYKKPQPAKFKGVIQPRDAAQREFMETLAALIQGPKPQDIVANARTGTGKTVTALWCVERVIQAPTLITVPTVYLLNQWRERIIGLFGQEWFDAYVGHIQQNKTDYEGRVITLGVAASLARRDYPIALRRYFTAIIFDEWHSIGTPSMGAILAKYPASVRMGLTATNRRDALLKVCSLHLGKPRVQSTQKVEEPTVFIVTYRHPNPVEIYSEGHAINFLARSRARNMLLLKIVLEGYHRGRNIVMLSDRVEQIQKMIIALVHSGVPVEDVGMIVGEYKDPETGKKRKMKPAEQKHVAATCKIIGATYGIFATGSDIDSLDMGVELTPRQNLRQAVGRVLRIKPGKPIPEWYSINDEIPVKSQTLGLFAPAEPSLYEPMERYAKARLSSYADQSGTVHYINAEDFGN